MARRGSLQLRRWFMNSSSPQQEAPGSVGSVSPGIPGRPTIFVESPSNSHAYSSIAKGCALSPAQPQRLTPFRQKQIPAMRLVKSGCDIFSCLVSVRSVRRFVFDTVIGGFSRRSYFPRKSCRTSDQHSQLSPFFMCAKRQVNYSS